MHERGKKGTGTGKPDGFKAEFSLYYIKSPSVKRGVCGIMQDLDRQKAEGSNPPLRS